LSGRQPADANEVELSATRLIEENCPRSGLELGAWWLAARGADIADTNALVRRVFEWAETPSGMSAMCYMPVALALYAERTRSARLLDQIRNASAIEDRSLWMQAHWSLARGYAARALQRAEGAEHCRSAADQFDLLHAPFLAAFAAAAAGTATRAQSTLLDDLGVIAGDKRTSAVRKSQRMRNGVKGDGLTPREREVAARVALGETNREIARTLFLSERTVEVHISNAFGKLGISSRSQLTRWVIERNAAQHGAQPA
jgi:DNA-binding CsgD family transcriptional regulator